MAIIFLGVSFFAGINATEPDMILSADKYFKEQRLSDFKIFSPLGFTQEDLENLSKISGVEYIQKGYSRDLFFTTSEGVTSVVKLMSYDPDDFVDGGLNIPFLIAGRLPQKSGEVLLERGGGVPREIEIGSKITVTLPDNEDPLTYLKTAEFTVVGFMSSPLYITYERDLTNIGDGSIDYIAYILADDFKLDSYNEVYVKLQDSEKYLAYSPSYQDILAKPEKEIVALGQSAMARETKALREELEKGKQTFLEQKALAEAEMAAGAKRLEEAEQAIINGEKELKAEEERYTKEIAVAKAEIEAGKEALAAGRLEYYNGYAAWLDGYNRYQDEKLKLQEAKAELDAAKLRLEAGERELEAARQDLASARTQLDYLQNAISILKTLEESLPENDSGWSEEDYEALLERIRQLDPDLAKLIENNLNYNDLANIRSALRAAIAELEKQYAEGEKQYQEGLRQLAEGEKMLKANKALYEEGYKAYEDGAKQLAEAKAEIDEAKAEIDAAGAEIDKQAKLLKTGEKEIEQAEKRLAKEIAAGYRELEEAKKELAEGKEIFAREKEEAEQKIAEAEAEIKEAERQLLELPTEWFVYTREGNPGYAGYGDDAERVGAVAKVFPLFFFLVAALVCLTTMTRMIEEERIQIGTMKALGYSTLLIASKYLFYALLASVVGSVAGVLVGFQLFPRLIMSIYANMYVIPHMLSPFHLDYALLSLGIAMLTTVVAALAACLVTLQETPAQLMQPRAPKPGKRILLERITFLWQRLNFMQKVTLRNLFRYKKRLLMTVLGIAGCTALLLTGYGIRDSVNALMDKQFAEIFVYDGIIMVKEQHKLDILSNQQDIAAYTAALTETVTVFKEKSGRNFEVNLLVPEDERNLPQFVKLRERVSGEALPLTENGAVITEKLAKLLNVDIGDSLSYRDTRNRTYTFKVAGIAENYLTHYIFMSPAYFDRVTLRTPEYNAGIFNLYRPDEIVEQQFKESLMREESVLGVALIKTFRKEFHDSMSSLDYIVWILIIAAGALAFVVLYNLTNINITERIREIATIKVLGFRDREVSAYVYRENIILVLLGTILGLIMGVFLHKYVIVTMEVDNMMFGQEIMPASYFFAVVLTFLFSALVNFFMFFRLQKVDMVESLKSVE
ncbi:MAG: FtsX-like permease family protein [Firmicutes bacterium]|nr:FtsX-like permease family protein [Bacillota bacterium]